MTVYRIDESLRHGVQAWVCLTNPFGKKPTDAPLRYRMLTGSANFRTKAEAQQYRQLTYTCLTTILTRTGETLDFPAKPVRFPW